MAMTEDLTVFFDTDDFAVSATYKAGGVGSGVSVSVIFDAPNQDHMGIAGSRPMATGKASDFLSTTIADTLTIGAIVYRIVDARPIEDGSMVELQLEDQT